MNINKKTKELIQFIKTDKSFRDFRKGTRFWWYDLLLLDVLSKDNQLGAKIFSKLFKRNSAQKIFKFLDEETNVIEDISIFITISPFRFILALFRRIFLRTTIHPKKKTTR